MSDTNLIQNNENLVNKLTNSHLPDENKMKIEPLIPQMNEEEKAGLLELIEDSEKLNNEIDDDKAEKMTKLNEEFAKKSDELLRDLPRQAMKKMEGVSKDEDENAMNELDNELSNL